MGGAAQHHIRREVVQEVLIAGGISVHAFSAWDTEAPRRQRTTARWLSRVRPADVKVSVPVAFAFATRNLQVLIDFKTVFKSRDIHKRTLSVRCQIVSSYV